MISNDLKTINDSELIMLYNDEDEIAKDIVYYKYKFIIDVIIKKYFSLLRKLGLNYEELYAECLISFNKALKTYNQNDEASLTTYITFCIERKIKDIIKKYSQKKYNNFDKVFSLDFPYFDNHLRFMDIVSDDGGNDPLKNMAEAEEYTNLLKKITKRLTPKENEVFSLLYEGLNYQEIAKTLAKNPKQIDNTIQRIKLKIKNLLIDKKEKIL